MGYCFDNMLPEQLDNSSGSSLCNCVTFSTLFYISFFTLKTVLFLYDIFVKCNAHSALKGK